MTRYWTVNLPKDYERKIIEFFTANPKIAAEKFDFNKRSVVEFLLDQFLLEPSVFLKQ